MLPRPRCLRLRNMPFESPVPRTNLHRPSESSRLVPARDPSSIFHNWRATNHGNNRGNEITNQNGALITELNRLEAKKGWVSDGMHPFKIYQLPSQYRPVPTSTDYLKFRCRTGGFLQKPTIVPNAYVGIQVPDPAFAPSGQGGWQTTVFGSNFNEYRGNNFNVGWANPDTGSGTGVPFLGAYSGVSLPLNFKNEVYLTNGGDPEYTAKPDSISFFWIQMDVDGNGVSSANIHFGGWLYADGSLFGDKPPWIVESPTGFYFGNLYSLPVVSNVISTYTVLGDINIFNGKVYIGQYIHDHLITLPDNYFRYVGQYDDSHIYWTGDIVTDSGEGGPSIDGFWVQLAGLANFTDSGPVSGYQGNVGCIGISGTSPFEDGWGSGVKGVFWQPLVFPSSPYGSNPWPSLS